jgi:hypothetical protein
LFQVITGMAVLTLMVGCQNQAPTSPGSNPPPKSVLDRDPVNATWFSDEAEATSLDFVHFNGMSGEYYFCEMMGSGAALFDYDNDGDLDVYVVQGNMLGPGKTLSDARFPPQGLQPLKGRLYRNDLVINRDGTRTLHFTDVTDASRLDARGYGMGVATGDFNNDGWTDLYLTNFGSNQMFRNNGDGAFTDVTQRTGTDDPRWSVSAAFLDYDRDGWLDLFVGNYLNYSMANHKECYSTTSARDYCGPRSYDPVPNRLFHNRGDGTFEDVSATSHIARDYDGALGVVCADFNRDDWTDIYVANDQRSNHLWINQKNGAFNNDAMLAGCALNRDGHPEASMGVDAGDFDGDGDDDLFMTHLVNEKNTLYVNDGQGLFEDRSFETGLGTPSLVFTAFGTAFFDYDNDGWLDILTVNGDVKVIEALARANDPYPLHQPNQLFRNLGNGQFEEVTNQAGAVFKLSEVSRGAAFGDVDNDGDTDVLVTNNNGRARLLMNTIGHRRHWLGLRFVDQHQRDALGARVMVSTTSGQSLWRRVHTDSSYASANDPRVLVGLGDATDIRLAQVYWPSGRIEQWTGLVIDRYMVLREGSGQTVK